MQRLLVISHYIQINGRIIPRLWQDFEGQVLLVDTMKHPYPRRTGTATLAMLDIVCENTVADLIAASLDYAVWSRDDVDSEIDRVRTPSINERTARAAFLTRQGIGGNLRLIALDASLNNLTSWDAIRNELSG